MESAMSAQKNTDIQKNAPQENQFGKKAMIRGLAFSIVINGVLPLIIYNVLKDYTHVSDFVALVITGVPSLIDSLVGIILRKRIDFLAGMVLFGIVVSLGLVALGGSPRLYLVRDSFFTAAYGIVLLVSLPFPKPVGFYTARYFVTGNNAERVTWFNNTLWQYAPFRTAIRVQTAIWGIGFVLEGAVRAYLAFTWPIPQFLVISPVVNWGFLGAIFVLGGLYMRQWKKHNGSIIEKQAKKRTGAL